MQSLHRDTYSYFPRPLRGYVSHLSCSFSHRYVGLAHPPIFFIRITDGASHLSLIPSKYHVFISPSLRRIYLGEDTIHVLINSLNTEVILLNARVDTLKRDKDLFMDHC